MYYYNTLEIMIEIIFEKCIVGLIENHVGATIFSRALFILASVLYNVRGFYDEDFVEFDGFPQMDRNITVHNSDLIYLYIYATSVILGLLNADPLLLNNSATVTTFLTTDEIFTNRRYLRFKNNLNNKRILRYVSDKINAYYTTRDGDGWRAVTVPSDYPNGDIVINPNVATNFTSYPHPLEWTPVGAKFYLTPHWGDVRGVFTASKTNEYVTFTEGVVGTVDLQDEARQVYNQSLVLGDKEKCISEMWNCDTITPPGLWNLFLISYFKQKGKETSLHKKVYDFMVLNAGLFQASIIVWKIKYTHKQPRPIQTIRYYFQSTIPATALWIPYRNPTNLVPPFPNFVSGHSSFSSVGSKILAKLIGDDIPSLGIYIDGDFMKYVSPLFRNRLRTEDKCYVSSLNIYPDTSEIDATVPKNMVTLFYNTWEELASECGVSRIYGGVHYPSSNYSGILLGNKMSEDVFRLFETSL